MVSFIVYDLVFFALFALFVFLFLYQRRANLKREGLLYLYRTQLGVRFIDRFTKSYRKILKPLQYVVLASGYILMVSVTAMMVWITYLYIKFPILSEVIKAPPIAPLIPYFPEIFGLQSFFPPLYFTYFLIALAFVAIFHEFAHGIYARFYNLKILSTGFAFLGPILGAFVEPDENEMKKAKKFPQLVILAAGTFANVILTVIFGLLIWGLFAAAFAPAGVVVGLQNAVVNTSQINVPAGANMSADLIQIDVDGKSYLANPARLQQSLDSEVEQVLVYEDAPAARANLQGAIISVDNQKTNSVESLIDAIQSHEPGETVIIKTVVPKREGDPNPEIRSYKITFAENEGKAYLGVGITPSSEGRGLIGLVYANTVAKIKDPSIYYESELGTFGWFVYYLLWWLVFINFAVALFNMMPLGFLDGGRFFYLTAWAIAGKESIGKWAYKIATWIILAMFALLMIRWAFSFF